jgi:hypothetical protein
MSVEYVEIDGETYAYESEESKREKRKLRYDYFLRHSGIPEFYHSINFEDWKKSAVVF